MEKYFDNLTLGQFILTGIKPIKVYVEGRYLILTDTDDIEDPLYGYGMTQSGAMESFDYRVIDHILIGNKPVTLEMLNKSKEGEEEPEAKGEEAPAEEEAPEEEKPAKEKKKEESVRSSKLTDIIKEGPKQELVIKKKQEYLKAKMAADKEAMQNLKKGIGESDEYRPIADDTAYSNVYEDDEDDEWDDDDEELDFDVEDDEEYDYEDEYEYDGEMVDNEYVEDDAQQDVTAVSEPYSIKVGDLVHNTDASCKHYGSKGFVISIGPDGVRYSITNQGAFHRLGDIVTKDLENLEAI